MATLLHSESRRLYSWWWDSHMSPKNSKWLQENLTDMDTKVKAMIKLIEEDADSFARRAEMYYKKRPELMKLVEEFYRAYRALAERYDHATGELRQAHRTMAVAFPNQVPFALTEDSPSGSSVHESEPHTPEMAHPIRALLDPGDLHKDALVLSASDLHAVESSGTYSEVVPQNSKCAEGRMIKGVNHETKVKEQNFHHEVSQLTNEYQNPKSKALSESKHAGKAEVEVQNLKKAIARMQDEKEAVLLQYQQSLEKLSNLEGELNRAQKDSQGLHEQAIKAQNEVQKLKESVVKLEAERDAGLLQHKGCLERISNLEAMIYKAQADAKGINERAIRAEIESQYLKKELSKLESEKEAGILQYKQSLEIISDLENKLLLAEREVKLLNERAGRAETKVKKLEKTLAELNREKEAAALLYDHCLDKISKLESEMSCAQEDVERLNSEILMGAEKLKSADEKCVLLETSNQSLRLELDNLAKKIEMKDQELLQKDAELEKLRTCVQDENLRFVQVEATLLTLQNLYTQSQEEQRALALELKNGLQILKDSEICKHGLEEEIRQVKDKNQSLIEVNLSSTSSMQNLQYEVLSLREMKTRLEDEVALQMGQGNTLQQEINDLKQEIKGLNRRYEALLDQVESVGLNPECLRSSVKNLQDENSKLRQICEQDRHEKEAFFKKLENMEKLLEKNAILESSLSDVNGELEALREKVRTLQESCQFLHGEKSTLVTEKAALLCQLQIVTETMQKLLDKNTILENSLSGANLELDSVREKLKSLEEVCQLLKNEKSNLLTERGALVVQLENVEQRLEKLEKRFTRLEERYTGLEKEKESTVAQVEELKISLGAEKQERASFTLLSETRLASLENNIHLMQEESGWKKKDLEEELGKAVKAQFEIFILQKFLQDMEEKNYSLLIDCQKHVEASNLTEKLISELERENLEQQVEAELLLDEIEKLRMGIYQVFKALETGPNNGCENKIENEQTFVHHILGNIEDMKCALSKYNDDEQQLWVENTLLLTTIGQLKLEGLEIESEKKILDQEFKTMIAQLVMVQNEKNELLEMNRQLRSKVTKGDQQVNVLQAEMESLCMKQGDLQGAHLELKEAYYNSLEENTCLLKNLSDLKEEKFLVEEENNVILQEILTLGCLSVIFKSFVTEKAMELTVLSKDLHNLNGVNSDLGKEVMILRGNLEMKGTENFRMKDSFEKLEKELHEVRKTNDQLKQDISSGKDFLRRRETELSEAEQKFKAADDLNLELCRTVEGLRRECKELEIMKENLGKQILELCEGTTSQNKEIECLHEANGNLEFELCILHEEIEECRIREENLNSELQERSNEFQLWEAEAATFYFDLQISAVREDLLQHKVHELSGVCESLENESASKTLEIEQMKERVHLMEAEIGELKAQLFAYAPLIVSLRENVASLEENALFWTKLSAVDDQKPKVGELAFHLRGKSSQDLMEYQNSAMPNGISDLQCLQTRIKAVEKVLVEEMERSALHESLKINTKLAAAMQEMEELKSKCSSGQEKVRQKEEMKHRDELGDNINQQKTKSENVEVRYGILMKDIPLDQVSDGSLYGIRTTNNRADDQMPGLWETAEGDRPHSIDHTIHESHKQAYALAEDDFMFDNGEQKSEDPSSELQVEKELSVDKLEVSRSVTKPIQGGNKRKILERLVSDTQKLMSLQITVEDLRRKLQTIKNSKKAKNVDFETVKEQFQEVEETLSQLVDLNGQLTKDIEESTSCSSCSDGQASTELEAGNVRRKRVSEQARKGSEKIGRLQLEVQKIQYVLLKLEDEKKGKGRKRLSRSRTSIILKDFIHSGRRNSERRRKVRFCGCFRPSTSGDGNHI